MSAALLRGRIVFVTGASGQVGWGIAHAAQDAGANVVLPTRSEEARVALVDDFGDERALVANVDFTSVEALERLRDEVLERFGTLDHVVAPLGAWWQKGISLDQSPGELRGLLDAYVEAQWRLLKAMAPALRASNGSYTFITGAAGEARDIPGAGLLVVAVSAQFALSRVLRHELAREPFRVNEVRFNTRLERKPRPGVIPSRQVGEVVLDVLRGDTRGALYRHDGGHSLMIDPGG